MNPIGPHAFYDEASRCDETRFIDDWRQHGLPVEVPRIFNTGDPCTQLTDGHAGSNFILQALVGETLAIYGDGWQTRSFCFVDDLIDGFVRLMLTADSFCGLLNLKY